jgi:hypothetical protein
MFRPGHHARAGYTITPTAPGRWVAVPPGVDYRMPAPTPYTRGSGHIPSDAPGRLGWADAATAPVRGAQRHYTHTAAR